jgi:hypothetical protein
MASIARMVFVISGVQGGKTILGPVWMYEEIRRLGAGDYLAVTTNYGLFKLKMLPALIEYFENILHIGRYWAGLGVIEIKHPTRGYLARTQNDQMYARIILRSAASPATLESATAKAAWLDECGQDEFKYGAWEAIQRRLSIHQGRVLGTTTPYNLGWLKTFVYDRWMDGDPTYDVVQFPSTLNPAFPQDEYDRAKDTLPGYRFEMFYNAQFAKPFGLIYKDFDETMIEKKLTLEDFPKSWPVVVGIDFGGANTATIYLIEDITQTPSVWYVVDGYVEGGVSSKEHVRRAKERLGNRANVRYVGGAPSETQNRTDWGVAGIKIEEPPFSDVEVGISNVIELFKAERLRVLIDVGGIIDQLAKYKRVVTDEGDVTDEILHKHDFHWLDGLRYGCSIITNKYGKRVAGAR